MGDSRLLSFLFGLLLIAAAASGVKKQFSFDVGIANEQPYEHRLKKAWTTPLKVGQPVPNVTFATRTRVEDAEDEENPFDWKSTSVLGDVVDPGVALCAMRSNAASDQ